MADTPSCPTTAELQQFAQGELPESRLQTIEKHLKICPRCAESVGRRASEGSTVADPRSAARVGQERPTGTLRGNDTSADAPTLAHEPNAKESDIDTTADVAAVSQTGIVEGLTDPHGGSSDEPTVTYASNTQVEGLEFLAPPQGPGELGRLGSYRVLKVLGSGGMGIVFEAEDLQLGRTVALKVMKAAVAAGLSARQRFQLEARSMAAVKSDHIATIYQVGEDRGAPYLAMELLHGQSVDSWLTRGHKPSTREILRLGREVALGLAAAHERGVIHRDVKPGSIWLEEPSGRIKLLDFGLARATAEDVHLTASGAVVGTPAYMAPEQARGDKFDHRADLFSLGVVLYRLCTAKMPFRGQTTMAVLSALAIDKPQPVQELAADVPPALADLIMKLLAKNPVDRPATATDIVAAIEAIERGAAALPSPEPSLRRRSGADGRHRWRLGMAAAALFALLGPLGWFFGPTIIRVVTGKGELVIDVDDPDVEVVVKPDGVRIRSGKEQTVIVTAGDGVVEVSDPTKGWTLVTEKFTLKRGGKEVVRVKREALSQARDMRAKELQALAAADKEKSFVVAHGEEKARFKTFAEALTQRKPGDAIEVRGNGPFDVPAAEVDGGLILRAAAGCRPIFVARIQSGAQRPWLAVHGGDVVVEGCDFHSDTIFPNWFFASSPEPRLARSWTFRNCRFWVNGPRGLIACAVPRLILENCLIASAYTESLLSLSPRVDLEMTNNLVTFLGPHAIVAPGNQSLRLVNNTIDGGLAFLQPPLDEAPARPVTVIAEGNVFREFLLLGDSGIGMPSEKITRTQVKWQGENNFYVHPPNFYRPYGRFEHDKRELKSLADWNEFWGRTEPGSIEVPWIGLQLGAALAFEPVNPFRIARQEVEAVCRQLATEAKNAGPDWDLVGPGKAYQRARERTSGKLLSQEQIRPPAPVGGAFVLVSNREPRGYASLQAALDATLDGDVVEVRTDGPFPGALLKAPQRAGSLKLRAAAGYRPVPATSIRFEVPKADVEVEGLAFVDSHLSGEFGRLTVRNCTLRGFREGVALSCVLHGTGQVARFLNSDFGSGPSCSVGPGQSVLIENSVIARASIDPRANDDDCEAVIRRSLCWAGSLGSGTLACDRSPNARPRFHAEDTVFVGGGVLTGSGGQARWSGRNNVYSLIYGFAIFQQFYSLEGWQKRWGSDRGSVWTPSPFLQPRMWRFLPGQPKRPNGKDYGADVERVARTP